MQSHTNSRTPPPKPHKQSPRKQKKEIHKECIGKEGRTNITAIGHGREKDLPTAERDAALEFFERFRMVVEHVVGTSKIK